MNVVRCKSCRKRGTEDCPFQDLQDDLFFCAKAAKPRKTRSDKGKTKTRTPVKLAPKKKEKRITFHTSMKEDIDMIYTWDSTLMAIQNPVDFGGDIHTTQMGLMDVSLLSSGFRLFIDDRSGLFEIRFGNTNERTRKHISLSTNLYKMWLNGELMNSRFTSQKIDEEV